MVSFKDYKVLKSISFKENKTQTMIFDPNVEMMEKQGQNGKPYPVIPVDQEGKVHLLSVGNKNLAEQLQTLTERTRITVTQVGSGFDTKYEVKVVGKR